MHIRPITREDIPTATSIFCDAFIDDAYFALSCPYRREYPLAWRKTAAEDFRQALFKPGVYGFVCVADNGDGKGEKDEILGCAVWERKGPATAQKGDPYMNNNKTVSATIERWLRLVESKYENYVSPNPCICPLMAPLLGNLPLPETWTAINEGVMHWYLKLLAISPRHQRKGVGQLLLKWGIANSREESAIAPTGPTSPLTLIASPNGQRLYRKVGFTVIGWSPTVPTWEDEMTFGPERNRKELRTIYEKARDERCFIEAGGAIMVYEPRDYWLNLTRSISEI